MASLKNWDNKTWLSSQNYIHSFNSFLLKQVKLDKNSRILDIGCGRGKILADLSIKLKLQNKPIVKFATFGPINAERIVASNKIEIARELSFFSTVSAAANLYW